MSAAQLEEAPPDDEPPFEDEPHVPVWQRIKCWTGTELESTDFPPLRWIVHDLLPAGLSLLVGAPKVGKSWAALDIGLAVASGGRALGSLQVEEGDVLFLALEDGPRRLSDRQRLLLGDAGGASDRFHAFVEWPRGIMAPQSAREWCEAHPDARLVVVDTLARVRPPQSSRGQAYSEDTAALVPWQAIAQDFSVAVVIVHHDRKAESADFIDAVSGTHGLAGVADTTLVLDRPRMETYGRLRLTGRDIQEAELTLRRAGPAWVISNGPAPDADLGDLSNRIVAYVIGAHRPVRAGDVAEHCDTDASTARRYLARLAEAPHHRIGKTGRGLYTAPLSSVPTVPNTTKENPQ